MCLCVCKCNVRFENVEKERMEWEKKISNGSGQVSSSRVWMSIVVCLFVCLFSEAFCRCRFAAWENVVGR